MSIKILGRIFLQNKNEIRTLVSTLRLYSQEKYDFIKVSKVSTKNNVGLIQFNRPKYNPLSDKLVLEVGSAIQNFTNDSSVGAIILTGHDEKAFAAGADIKEMSNKGFSDVFNSSDNFAELIKSTKPLIAAVNGYALGGGCEIAMMCDIIYAGEKALFGQPEILIGIIPGAGGTQRLIRSVGKSKAMEMVLTGNPITAQEAERIGLISKVFPVDKVLDESIKLAEKIASNSQITNAIAKECVETAHETSLQQGLRFERRMFHACFATKDQTEGMTAFIEKRKADFRNE